MTIMVMKKAARERRVGVAEAKAELSRVLREAPAGPTIIHSRGRDLAVIVDIDEYQRLRVQAAEPEPAMSRFLDRIAELKRRSGGGVDFAPEPLDYVPVDPFANRR